MSKHSRGRRLGFVLLASFVLSLATVTLAPWLKPLGSDSICSATAALKQPGSAGDSGTTMPAHGLDCPYCATQVITPPTAAVAQNPLTVPSLAHAMRAEQAAHIAWLTSAPLPPRGPPTTS